MKRKSLIISLILFVSVVLFSLTSCFGTDNPTQDPGTNDPGTQEQPKVVYSIDLDKEVLELEVDEEATLVATLLADGKACSDAITWTTSNDAVASVENGKVTALSAGTATITASAHDVSKSATVTVTEVEVFLILNNTSSTLKVGETLQLSATLTDGSNPTLTYTSSDSNVASVSESGLITALVKGETTIEVSAGEGLTATCKVVVEDVYELIFPTIEQTSVFVGDVIDLNPVLKVNGEISSEPVEILGEGFSVEGDVITITNYGEIVVTVKFGELQFSQTLDSWIKISTVEDYAVILEDLNGHYKLVNDLDFNGGTLITIGHYVDDTIFSGIFDGQGHSIMNYSSVTSTNGTTANSSPFGRVSGIVRNVNFINGVIADRIAGGVATEIYAGGLVENCFVEVLVKHNTQGKDFNNPIGGIASKNMGSIKNCVVVLHLAEGIDTTNIGAIVGRNMKGTEEVANSYALASVGIAESAQATNNSADPVGTGIVSSEVFATLEELIAALNEDATYGDMWTIVENQYPHLGTIEAPVQVENIEAYVGTDTQLTATSKFAVSYSLAEPVEGVSIAANGLLSIEHTVVADTVINVLVQNNYGGQATLVVTTKGLPIEVSAEDISLDFIVGITSETLAHNVVVKYMGEVYEGEDITFSSSNELVATVDATNLTIVGEGNTTITVSYKGLPVTTFEVKIVQYYPVRTVEEFLAIGTDQTTMSYKYLLMNDIDFGGATVHALSSYGSRNTLAFKGSFDGQGHTLSNMVLAKSNVPNSGSDAALFGYICSDSTVIKNLNVIGAELASRGGVIASWVDKGTIENCYVDVKITGLTGVSNQNNMGAIAWRVQAASNIRNCISVVTVAEGIDTTYVGAVVGMNLTNLTNCQAIVLSGEELKASPCEHNTVKGKLTNTNVYTSISAFYDAVDTTLYSSDWKFDENKKALPHLGELDASIAVEAVEAYTGVETQLTATSKCDLTFTLAEAVEGVSISVNGLLTVASTVAADTTINVLVQNNYGGQTTIVVTTKNLPIEVTSVESILVDKLVLGTDNVLPHNISVTLNGESYSEGITYVSSNEAVATVDATNVTLLGEGTAKISVLYNGEEIHSFDVTVSAAYTPVRTVSDFMSINTDATTRAGKYMLMNDIDFEGAEFTAFSSQKNQTVPFLGVFDGNGYSLMNIKPVQCATAGSTADRSIFGVLGIGAVIKNLSVTGAEMTGWGGVIASYVLKEAVIENCYVEVTVTGTDSVKTQNDLGAFVFRLQANATIRNCISVVTVAEGVDTSYVAGVVGMNLGKIVNCQSIVTSGNELKVFTSEHASVKGTVSNSAVYASAQAFYEAVDTTLYSSQWVFDTNKQALPTLGTLDATISAEAVEVYAGMETQLTATSKYGLTYSLAEAVEGVSISSKGLLTVASTVAADTTINVLITNVYGGSVTLVVTVKVLPLEVTSVESITVEECISGTENAHNISVTLNGEAYSDGITYTSSNEAVATVDATNVKLLSEGTAKISVLFNGVEIHSFDVTISTVWYPVRTIDDFMAINTDATTRARKYILMNDLDFEGAEFAGFSSSKNQTVPFAGTFDGNGYSIKNIKPVQCATAGSTADRSIFGVLGVGAVIKNLSVTGAEMTGWGGVIASYVLKQAVIENCYVEVTVTGTDSVKTQNDLGAFVFRLQANATIRNCISVVTVAEGVDTTYVAGVVGMNLGKIENCQTIVTSGNELKVFTSEHASVKGTVSNSAVYTSAQAFYEAVDTTLYSSQWVFDANKQELPYLAH